MCKTQAFATRDTTYGILKMSFLWLVNNVLSYWWLQLVYEEHDLETSILGLRFKVREKHFYGGDLKLKCTATIATIYWRSNEESVQGVRSQSALASESRTNRNSGTSGDDRWGACQDDRLGSKDGRIQLSNNAASIATRVYEWCWPRIWEHRTVKLLLFLRIPLLALLEKKGGKQVALIAEIYGWHKASIVNGAWRRNKGFADSRMRLAHLSFKSALRTLQMLLQCHAVKEERSSKLTSRRSLFDWQVHAWEFKANSSRFVNAAKKSNGWKCLKMNLAGAEKNFSCFSCLTTIFFPLRPFFHVPLSTKVLRISSTPLVQPH